MNLDKSDLQQIEKIVNKRAQITERQFEKDQGRTQEADC